PRTPSVRRRSTRRRSRSCRSVHSTYERTRSPCSYRGLRPARAPPRVRRSPTILSSRCCSFRRGVVNPNSGLWVEEVQGAGVDRGLHVLSLFHARACAEPTHDHSLAFPDADLLLGRSGILGEFPRLVGLGVRAFDREVGHDLGAECFAELEPPAQTLIRG